MDDAGHGPFDEVVMRDTERPVMSAEERHKHRMLGRWRDVRLRHDGRHEMRQRGRMDRDDVDRLLADRRATKLGHDPP